MTEAEAAPTPRVINLWVSGAVVAALVAALAYVAAHEDARVLAVVFAAPFLAHATVVGFLSATMGKAGDDAPRPRRSLVVWQWVAGLLGPVLIVVGAYLAALVFLSVFVGPLLELFGASENEAEPLGVEWVVGAALAGVVGVVLQLAYPVFALLAVRARARPKPSAEGVGG